MNRFDPASRARLRMVYPDVAVRWVRVANDVKKIWGLMLKIPGDGGARTYPRQDLIYAQGRTLPGAIVTNARAGESWHCFGLSIDSCFQGPDPYLEKHPDAAKIWRDYGLLVKAHGMKWGGDFTKPDRPHCEMLYGLMLPKARELFTFNGLTGVWAFCDRQRDVPQGSEWMGPQSRVRLIATGQLDEEESDVP